MPGSTTSNAAVDALVDDHFAAEIAGDLDRLLSTFAEDVEHDVVGNPSVSKGKDQVRDFYVALHDDLAFEEIRSVRRYHGDGHVVDEAMVRARAIGSPFGLPGGGRSIELRLLHVFEVRDGAITRENAWIDVASVIAQLGEQARP
jgi:steroid delta-isomerase-like uncharacterized protein